MEKSDITGEDCTRHNILATSQFSRKCLFYVVLFKVMPIMLLLFNVVDFLSNMEFKEDISTRLKNASY